MNAIRSVWRLLAPAWARRAARIAMATAENFFNDRCISMSAALAFYAAFSLAPMLVVAVAVGSVFLGERAVEGRLFTELESLIGRDAALAAQAVFANAWRSGQASTLGWVSLLGTALGATATFAELNSALNEIWRAPPARRMLASLIRARVLSFGLVLGAGFLVVVLLIADAAIVYVTETVLAEGALGKLIGTVQQLMSFAFLCLVFAVLIKVLPDVAVEWRDAGRGAVAGALLFALGKHLFALYLAHAGGTSVFGAASSLAVLMMWLFFSAAAFLVGAELAATLARERGALGRPKPEATWQSR